MTFFEAPSSPLGGDGHMCSLSFLHEIDFTIIKPSEGRCSHLVILIKLTLKLMFSKFSEHFHKNS